MENKIWIFFLIISFIISEENTKNEEIKSGEILNDFNCWKILGLFLNFLANIMTNYIGVTGSGLVYSIFIFLFGYKTKKAIPIYKLCNLFASIFNIIYVFQNRK